MDVFKFKGYGIYRLDEKIFPLLQPKKNCSSAEELYSDGTLSSHVFPKDSKVLVDMGVLEDNEDDEYYSPGTVLYIPEIVTNVLNMPVGHNLDSLLADALKEILDAKDFTLKPDANLNEFVKENATTFSSEGAFY